MYLCAAKIFWYLNVHVMVVNQVVCWAGSSTLLQAWEVVSPQNMCLPISSEQFDIRELFMKVHSKKSYITDILHVLQMSPESQKESNFGKMVIFKTFQYRQGCVFVAAHHSCSIAKTFSESFSFTVILSLDQETELGFLSLGLFLLLFCSNCQNGATLTCSGILWDVVQALLRFID